MARASAMPAARSSRQEPSEPFRKTVTILFSDVVDSTDLGERLDPETLSRVLTDYFEGCQAGRRTPRRHAREVHR